MHRRKLLLARKLAAEGLGTALLLSAIVGSGIAADRLSGGNAALALLANCLATGAALVVLTLVFGPVSGAHLNPAVTLAEALRGKLPWRHAPSFVLAQLAGAFAGVALAHLMFGLPLFFASAHVRAGSGQVASEAVATFGLLLTVLAVARGRPGAVPFAVGLYIVSAFWFTASTSFANPAVTLARAATGSFAGIRLADVPAFLVAQLAGAAAAVGVFGWLWGAASDRLLDDQ